MGRGHDAGGVPFAGQGPDPLYRLTGIKAGSGTIIEAYTYNRTGDRLTKTAPGLLTGTYTYATGTHHLTNVGTTTRVVDARGNTTSDVLASGTFGYGYNQRNRMTVVLQNGTTVGMYVLNALGQRIQKTAGGVTTSFDYTEDSQLIGEASGTTTRDYVWLGGIPVAIVDGSGTTSTLSYVVADGLGTPRAVVDASGTTKWQWAYASNPFGENAPTSSSGYVLNLRYAGQYFDQESGLVHNGFRDYEAATGRYLQSDPIGLAGGASTFGYVTGRPLTSQDPSGLAVGPPPAGPFPPDAPARLPDASDIPENIPGGPWTPANGQLPGDFWGPQQPQGGKVMCRWVPREEDGGTPGSKGYWKTQTPGMKGWQRYDQQGNPMTAEEAHPRPSPRPSRPAEPVEEPLPETPGIPETPVIEPIEPIPPIFEPPIL
ncbi:RHS repeat-associated core domain-containing protein [Luteibacter pinisoli]|uniref:RHS repeat-associated core domain-containing protein n=1 Tax=Luteibacter pinisoli TaxID=2589080 RepID=A0A4Y5Z3Y8_9GAMM|nr:RHS repeat-associated core domain-containing protein [Luteibacter pinisoli]QDE39877.1 RHS repeat-associated core domain-containing protein [Luteibacter pinisoli]